jgi:hypothetical protein
MLEICKEINGRRVEEREREADIVRVRLIMREINR